MNLTRSDLVLLASRKSGLSQADVSRTFETFLTVLTLCLKSGASVGIRGHYTFIPKTRKARPARNIRTGETVPLPERKTAVVRFHPGFL